MKQLLGLLGKIPQAEDAIYWSVLTGAASFTDRPALEALGKYIKENARSAVARDLLYGLAENPSPECVFALRPVLLEGPDDVRALAATKLGRIHAPESVDLLIEILVKEEKGRKGAPSDIAWLAADGLSRMTGQEFGPVSINWEGWWRQNRQKPLRSASEAEGAFGTGTAVDSLRGDRLRREGFLGVEKAPREAVVVLTAVYTRELQRDLNNDHMEAVLERMKVPHTIVRREDFQQYDLSSAGIVLINCAQFHQFCICPTCKPAGNRKNRLQRCEGCDKHILFSAELKAQDVEKLVNFVKGGGFIFAEDWVVKELVEKAFSDFVVSGVKLREPKVEAEAGDVELSRSDVDVVPARGMGTHPYLRGIFAPRPVDRPGAVRRDGEDEEQDALAADGERVAAEDGEEAGTEREGEGEGEGEGGGEGEEPTDDDDLPWEMPDRKTVVLDSDGVEIGPDGVRVKHTWKIDDESHALKVEDSRRVVSLLTSGRLQREAKGQGVVALAFRPGPSSSAVPVGVTVPAGAASRGVPGAVVCVLSHFGKQDSTQDEYSIQNLLLNVLIDAETARRGRRGK